MKPAAATVQESRSRGKQSGNTIGMTRHAPSAATKVVSPQLPFLDVGSYRCLFAGCGLTCLHAVQLAEALASNSTLELLELPGRNPEAHTRVQLHARPTSVCVANTNDAITSITACNMQKTTLRSQAPRLWCRQVFWQSAELAQRALGGLASGQTAYDTMCPHVQYPARDAGISPVCGLPNADAQALQHDAERR